MTNQEKKDYLMQYRYAEAEEQRCCKGAIKEGVTEITPSAHHSFFASLCTCQI